MRQYRWMCCILLSLLLSVTMLSPACAMQDMLHSLSDQELLQLRKLLETELELRGLAMSKEASAEKMVWIPRSGNRYHASPTCSNMKGPIELEISRAIEAGFTPCKRCKPGY